jgi:hypothetical protein
LCRPPHQSMEGCEVCGVLFHSIAH